MPEGAGQGRRNRDHIKDLRSVAGRFGRFVARVAWLSHHGPARVASARRDAIGIPVSILPSGGRSLRASAVFPLDEFLEARMSDPTTSPSTGHDRSRPPISPPASPRSSRRCATGSTLVPEVGIVLGSGLGGLADDLEDPVAIPFAELPGWPPATAPGHVGRLLLGRLGGRAVVMLQGRFHLYEGNDPGLVVQPVLLFQALGATIVVLTNAAGGLDPSFGPGTLMVMSDHINLTGRTPLLGPNADELGPRFPDLTDAWSPRLRRRLHAAGAAEGVAARGGGLRRPDRADVRDAGRGPDARRARWRRGRDVDRARVHRRPLGRPRGLRRLAGHERRGRLHRRAADPRGGPGGRAEAGPRLARVIRRFLADLGDLDEAPAD